MAWTSVISGGGHSKQAAGVVFSIGLDNSAMAGQVIFNVIAADNTTFSTGSSNDILAMTDASGNKWTKLAEYTQAGLVGSQGATVAIFMSHVTTTLNSGAGRMTATFAASINSCASTKWIFSVAAGSDVAFETATGGGVNASAQSLAISGLKSNEYLFIRGIAMKEITTTITPTTGYTAMGTLATGSTTISAMSVQAEFNILTGTNSTSLPNNASCEQASVFIAIQEIFPFTYRFMAMTGAGS